MTHYALFPREDYDKSIKISGVAIACYSPKKWRSLGLSSVVGETLKNNRKDSIAYLKLNEENNLRISSCEKPHNRLLYARVGYAAVAEDAYVVVLKSRVAFLLTFLLLLAAIGVACGILLSMLQTPEKPVIAPNHPLPEVDPDVRPLPPDNGGEGTNVSNGGGKVSMIYSLAAKKQESSGNITVLFKNPSASDHDVVLEMYIPYAAGDVKIAESGRIPAGNGLYTLRFIEDSATLGQGVYTAYYKVIYYDPVTGERALVESKIEDLKLEICP